MAGALAISCSLLSNRKAFPCENCTCPPALSTRAIDNKLSCVSGTYNTLYNEIIRVSWLADVRISIVPRPYARTVILPNPLTGMGLMGVYSINADLSYVIWDVVAESTVHG